MGISLILLSFITSCVDDKGNYDYKKVSTIEMDYPKNSAYDPPYQVEFTSRLIIDPKITITDGVGKDDFYYEWFLCSSADGSSILQLSKSDTTPVLDILLPEEMQISKTHLVTFRATNRLTNLSFSKTFQVTVKDRLQTGFLAITEKDAGVELDIIAAFMKDGVEELTLHTDILQLKKSAFPRAGRKPLGIYAFKDIYAPSPIDPNTNRIKYSVYLLTDKNTDRIKPEDFSFKEKSYNISQVSYIPDKYAPKEYIATKMAYQDGENYYAYMGGNWFFMNLMPTSIFFMYPINMYKGEETTYKTPPYIANVRFGAIIYNEDDHCFMLHKYTWGDLTNTKALFQTVKLADNPDDAFRFNNPNYDLVYMSNTNITNIMVNTSTNYNDVFAIVKEKITGQYELLKFSMTRSANIVDKSKSRKIIPANIDMAKIKYYSHHPSEPILYMASEDKVYRVITTTSNIDVRDITDEVLPPGEKVSCLKSMLKKIKRPLLAIATYKANGSLDKAGTLKMYEINVQNGDLTIAKHPQEPAENGYQIDMSWSGLGKIVDIEYKEQ